ncbi:MAG TPA: YidC/Oxa1 family membrane protein insertase [Candidatus Paceibacterota bacterium]|nr:YidC/Oxa1 family membrane protein insertase [Candidatus Paceibacterota bacterium]
MGNLFLQIIERPLLNLTMLLYGTIGFADLGLAIVLMTIVVRLVLLPLSLRTARTQREMGKLAPELERIKEKHKGDTAAQSEAVMKLYKEHNVNPLAGCLPLLIQIPLLLGLYRVFILLIKPEALTLLYSFIPHPGSISNLAFGFLDISTPSRILALVAGLLQFALGRMMSSSQQGAPAAAAAMNKQMMYLLPVIIVVIGWSLPAGLSLYWAVTTLFSVGEQLYIRRASGILPA